MSTSRIAAPAEAVDALLHYANLFVSEDGNVDAEKVTDLASSIAIVKNSVSGDTVCATLNTQALNDEIASLEALGYSYSVLYVEMAQDILERLRARVASWPRMRVGYTAADMASQGAEQFRAGYEAGLRGREAA